MIRILICMVALCLASCDAVYAAESLTFVHSVPRVESRRVAVADTLIIIPPKSTSLGIPAGQEFNRCDTYLPEPSVKPTEALQLHYGASLSLLLYDDSGLPYDLTTSNFTLNLVDGDPIAATISGGAAGTISIHVAPATVLSLPESGALILWITEYTGRYPVTYITLPFKFYPVVTRLP